MSELNHFDKSGKAHMVDVSEKQENFRKAIASGYISMGDEAFSKIKEGNSKKGDILGIARIAGIMAMKKTPDIIPLCHNIFISGSNIDFEILEDKLAVKVISTCKTVSQTGVEMEALTGVSAALLTIYDMLKAVDKSMTISDIHLEYKEGGKSGLYENRKK